MVTRILLLGVLAAFTANVAKATVYFDSVDVANANVGFDGASDGRTSLAQSFTVSSPAFSSITVGLVATTSSDGGSAAVYLVPDDGKGGKPGTAGSPEFLSSSGVFTGFVNAKLLGTINDAQLSTTPRLLSFSVNPTTIAAVTANTSDQEYWVAIVLSGTSSAGWEYNLGAPAGFGTAGQAYFNSFGGGGTNPVSGGAYDLIVASPEPTAIAVLGVGLVGLGYIRRRSTRRS